MRNAYLVHSVRKMGIAKWQQLLSLYLEKANLLRVLFPSDPDLAPGKERCLSLPDVSIRHARGAADPCEISGPLSGEAKQLLRLAQQPDNPVRLWSFELLLEDQAVLRLEDFTVCLVFATEEERTWLERQGIGPDLLQPVNLNPTLSAEEEVVPFSDRDTEDLAQRLLRTDTIDEPSEP